MKQENCPVCGRLMETLKTESGREIQICDRSSDPDRPHVSQITFPPDPSSAPTGE